MKIRIKDTVKIITGSNAGKTGKVLQVFPKLGKASVEGINLLVKNMKPRRKGEKGQRINFPSPVALANLALICPKCGRGTRVGYKQLTDQKKYRHCKKCGETIDG